MLKCFCFPLGAFPGALGLRVSRRFPWQVSPRPIASPMFPAQVNVWPISSNRLFQGSDGSSGLRLRCVSAFRAFGICACLAARSLSERRPPGWAFVFGTCSSCACFLCLPQGGSPSSLRRIVCGSLDCGFRIALCTQFVNWQNRQTVHTVLK